MTKLVILASSLDQNTGRVDWDIETSLNFRGFPLGLLCSWRKCRNIRTAYFKEHAAGILEKFNYNSVFMHLKKSQEKSYQLRRVLPKDLRY